jgi:hypothetical protein
MVVNQSGAEYAFVGVITSVKNMPLGSTTDPVAAAVVATQTLKVVTRLRILPVATRRRLLKDEDAAAPQLVVVVVAEVPVVAHRVELPVVLLHLAVVVVVAARTAAALSVVNKVGVGLGLVVLLFRSSTSVVT